jgi:hypothetical protein
MSELPPEKPTAGEAASWPARLDELLPHEFLALHRAAIKNGNDVESPVLRDYEDRSGIDFDIVLDEYLDSIPVRNLDRAVTLYECFAGSPEPEDRGEIANWAKTLTRASHDIGITFWHRLIRDPALNVRSDAHDVVDVNADSLSLLKWGLTPQDARLLDDAYRSAEQGLNLHDPVAYAGELAMRRLVQRSPSAMDQP